MSKRTIDGELAICAAGHEAWSRATQNINAVNQDTGPAVRKFVNVATTGYPAALRCIAANPELKARFEAGEFDEC